MAAGRCLRRSGCGRWRIPYDGDDSWVGAKVTKAMECFNLDDVPDSGPDCDNCRYFDERLALSEATKRVV
jgi:hypothetical protein